jgi:hypothetical protein
MNVEVIASRVAFDFQDSAFKRDVRFMAIARVGAEGEGEVESKLKTKLLDCLGAGLKKSLREMLAHVKELKQEKFDYSKLLSFIWNELKDKLNIRKIAREIWGMVREKGWKMAVVAAVWEIIEDVVFPAVAIYFGYPGLVPFFLTMHFEPFVLPIAYCLL